jgi:rhamnogalacturonyl hydrolase YesR
VRSGLLTVLLAATLSACGSPATTQSSIQPSATTAAAPVVGVVPNPRHSDVVAAMKRAANYYRPTYSVTTLTRNGWSWSTYFDGLHALYQTAGDQRYRNDAMAWGRSNSWSLLAESQEPNPNRIKAAQVYYDLHELDPAVPLAAPDKQMATDLTRSDLWYDWSDALFMGLPSWTRWATRTGDTAYLDRMDALYAWTRDVGIVPVTPGMGCTGTPSGLYDPAERLWYRDCTYIGDRDSYGHKVFWGRGNAWVAAALAEVLATLPPADPRAEQYAGMLAGMADRLRALQGSDGFWRSSLLSPALYPAPETSATALFTYAIADGINRGLLDRATYVPVVARAWNGLATKALQSTGFLRYVQKVGGEPGAPYTGTGPRVAPTATSAGTLHIDSPPYGVGAFLLAGSEMAKLTGTLSTGQPVTATAAQAGYEAARAVDGDVTTRWSAQRFPQSLTVDLGGVYRISNTMLTPFADRAYRYRVETSTDRAHWSLVVDNTANTTPGSRLDNVAGGTVAARYVRLTVTSVYGVATSWVSIQEFAVHDRYQPRLNLAGGRPAVATSSQSAYPPRNATDYRSSTFWVCAALPTAAAPQALTVDLGAVTAVDTVRVFSRARYGPKDVTVLASVDSLKWTALAKATLSNSEGPHTMLFPPASARWLRLQATSSYSGYNTQVEELEAAAPSGG